MAQQPFEFIDFSKFDMAPSKTRSDLKDPLALDIKQEIKEEPSDPLSCNNASADSTSCKDQVQKEYLDCDPLSINFPFTSVIKEEPPDEGCDPLSINFPFTSAVKEEPFEEVGDTQSLNNKTNAPSAEVYEELIDSGLSNVYHTSSEEWLTNSNCGRILSRDLENIIALSNNLSNSFVKRKKSNVKTGSKRHKTFNLTKKIDSQKPKRGRTAFYCHHCEYVAYQKGHIAVHIISIHIKKKLFACPDCKMKFSQKSGLNRHFSVHSKEKPFKCDRCEFTSSRKEGLKRHCASLHDNLRPYQCTECTYKSVRKYHLKCHIKAVHRKVKEFSCDKCSYAASRRSNLTNHIYYKHKGIKRFSCSECSFKATQKSNLKQHVDSVHNKIKAYVCHHCGHHTNHKGSLRGHINSFHMGRLMFQCYYCLFSCKKKMVLSKHMRKHIATFLDGTIVFN